jgi:hypothetical protein
MLSIKIDVCRGSFTEAFASEFINASPCGLIETSAELNGAVFLA